MIFNLFKQCEIVIKLYIPLQTEQPKFYQTNENYNKTSHIEKKPLLILYTYLLFLNCKTIISLYSCNYLMRASKLVFFK